MTGSTSSSSNPSNSNFTSGPPPGSCYWNHSQHIGASGGSGSASRSGSGSGSGSVSGSGEVDDDEECDRQSTTESNHSEASSSHNNIFEDKLTETLYAIFRKREIMKLHSVQGQVVAIFLYLAQKKENFEEMATASKIRCVSRNLEQLIEELPVFLLRIEEIISGR